VVTQSESQPRGLLVDRLIGKQEVVIKSLGSAFKGQASMSGAAILGDGLVALILDIENLGAPRAHHKNQPVPTA
jgi:two-component system chemotaxis sensor kinase CheA